MRISIFFKLITVAILNNLFIITINAQQLRASNAGVKIEVCKTAAVLFKFKRSSAAVLKITSKIMTKIWPIIC